MFFVAKISPFSHFPQKKNHPPPAVLYSGAQCPNDCRTSSGDTPESPGELPSGERGPRMRPKQQIPRSQGPKKANFICPRGVEFFSAFWWCKMVKRNDDDKILLKENIYIHVLKAYVHLPPEHWRFLRFKSLLWLGWWLLKSTGSKSVTWVEFSLQKNYLCRSI